MARLPESLLHRDRCHTALAGQFSAYVEAIAWLPVGVKGYWFRRQAFDALVNIGTRMVVLRETERPIP